MWRQAVYFRKNRRDSKTRSFAKAVRLNWVSLPLAKTPPRAKRAFKLKVRSDFFLSLSFFLLNNQNTSTYLQGVKAEPFSDLWTYLAIRVAARTIPYEGVCDVSPPPALSFDSRASLVDILPLTGPVTLSSSTAVGCEKHLKNATHTYTPQSRLTCTQERRVPLRCGWKVNTFTRQEARQKPRGSVHSVHFRFSGQTELPAVDF